jgi:tetratricopeptide (TPR) repeat protein
MKAIRWLLFLLILIGVLLLAQPDDAVAPTFVQRADRFSASLDYQLAADYLQVALIRQPWNVAVRLKLADALTAQRRTAEAEQALNEAERWGADRAEVEQRRAQLAEKNNQFDEAGQHWQTVTTLRPLDNAAYAGVVESALNAEQWAAARLAAEQWVTHTQVSDAHFALAKIVAFDDPVAAQDHFQQATGHAVQPFVAALQETDPPLRALLLGRAYLAENDLSLAQRAFDEAIRLNPTYAEAQAFAGFVRDQRRADGGAWLDRAVALDPDLIVARYFRARHRWAQADLDGALADLNNAIERDPANALIAAELGRVYTQRSDFPNAEIWLNKARELKVQDVAIWKSLAELYVGRSYGTVDQAVTTAQQIVALAPEDAEAHLWLGRAYLRSGDRSGAELELNEAVRLNPQIALAHFYVGRLYGRDTEAGRAAYERAVLLDPTGPIGAAAQRVLSLP